jgi:hypothetical protein
VGVVLRPEVVLVVSGAAEVIQRLGKHAVEATQAAVRKPRGRVSRGSEMERGWGQAEMAHPKA